MSGRRAATKQKRKLERGARPAAPKPGISLTQAMADPALFGKVFASPSFWTWKTVAKLIDGLPLTEPREIELFKRCTGRTKLPTKPVRRLIILAGRRAGKDRFESAVSVWRGALCADWREYQSAGEGAVVILLGADKKQAAILRKYCAGLLEAPLLAAEVARSTGDVTEFKNGGSLEIATNDARLVRGRSAVAVLGSECCHWKTDEFAASSDEEVVGAAEPSMAMCHDGGLLMLGSSVYRKRGYMHRKWRELFGNDEAEDICWFAPSAVMNPKLPARVVERALAEDPVKARAEYLNVWRDDQAGFLPPEVVEACTDWDVYERAPEPGVSYFAFADAAGGTGKDSYALCIAHVEADGSVMIDVVRERKPPFVPSQVIAEFTELLQRYRITEVRGDNAGSGFHAGEWDRHQMPFRKFERTTSENYLTALPVLLARRVRLLDNKTLRSQLTSLERTISASDKETVSHPRHGNAHDDVATAVCGAIVWASQAAKLAAFESKIVLPLAAGEPRAAVPGGYSFSSSAFVAPTPRSLTAPLPAPTKPAELAKPARNAPVQAVSGDEAKRRMAAVNARRDIDFKIMTEPSRVAGEPRPSLGNEPWRWPRR
jgi:hypothetical protein